MIPAVHLAGVSKRFRRTDRPRLVKDLVLRRQPSSPPLVALDGIELDVDAGSAVGVVGPNGAGKSTLLRVIAGVLVPDEGTVAVNGRVGSLLELGAGFHPDLTGRESAVLAGVVGGLSRREAQRSVEWVCDFAGLEQFIDRPLRTYSSGMQARLAFAIATQRQPEILLVDEVLAVGDVAFQQRCIQRMRGFQGAGTTLLLVSHDADLVRMLCDRALWLANGRVAGEGPVDDVVDAYLASGKPHAAAPSPDEVAAIRHVELLDERGAACSVIATGSPLAVAVELVPVAAARRLGVRVVRDDDLVCVDTGTELPAGATRAGLSIQRLDLAPGTYRVEVGVYDERWTTTIDHRHDLRLRVLGTASATAALAPPALWTVRDDRVTDDPRSRLFAFRKLR